MSQKPRVLVFQGGDRINSSRPMDKVKHGKQTGPNKMSPRIVRGIPGALRGGVYSYNGLRGNRGEMGEKKCRQLSKILDEK